MTTSHAPVMLEEVVAALAPEDGNTIVDATFGGGGHSRAVLQKLGPDGRLVGIDRDPEAAVRAADLLEDRRFAFRRGGYDEVLRA